MNGAGGVVYIVEDDASFRRSVERMILAAGRTAVSYASAGEFLQDTNLQRPACLLLDVRLPDIDGIRLQARLSQEGIDVPVIFMTGHGSISMGVAAMKRGAVDFLPKPFETADLLRAISEAIDRDAASIAMQARRNEAVGKLNKLTPREGEVLRWVITGRPNKQIAKEIGIAEATVKIHRARVMQKTGASSVADLIHLAELAELNPVG